MPTMLKNKKPVAHNTKKCNHTSYPTYSSLLSPRPPTAMPERSRNTWPHLLQCHHQTTKEKGVIEHRRTSRNFREEMKEDT
jgi:hypothetical protein